MMLTITQAKDKTAIYYDQKIYSLGEKLIIFVVVSILLGALILVLKPSDYLYCYYYAFLWIFSMVLYGSSYLFAKEMWLYLEKENLCIVTKDKKASKKTTLKYSDILEILIETSARKGTRSYYRLSILCHGKKYSICYTFQKNDIYQIINYYQQYDKKEVKEVDI